MPARRLNLSQQLSDRYRQTRPTAREIAEQTDQEIEQRALRSRGLARELDDDLREQSRNRQRISLNLRDQLRSRDFATTDNIRRRIDTMRNTREREMIDNRNREDAALLLQSMRRRNLTRRRQR